MAQEGQTPHASSSTSSSSSTDLSSVKEDLAILREDLQHVLEQVLETGKERGSALKDKFMETGRKVAEPAEHAIRERPLVSILVIFLVGLVLGKLMDLRRHG